MLNTFFSSIITGTVSWQAILLCTLSSVILGALSAGIYCYRNTYTKSFVVTLSLLPVIVQTVIMLVNGNLGAGVAVMGAFSLVRFRSAPGSAREIGALFVAMGTGLITGMGYLGYGALFTLILGGAMMLYNALSLRPWAQNTPERTLHITIPEDLDYAGVFDPVLHQYARRYSLTQVKTTNMGSLFKLTYDLTLKDPSQEKRFIDQLRLRNENLEISLGHQDTSVAAL